MKQLFLTSSVHAVAHDLAKRVDLSKGNKLVFITTAADIEEGDKTWLKNDRQALVKAGFSVTDYTIVGKTKEELRSDLKNYDYIYLSGGNTYYLLQQSVKTEFISIIKDLILKEEKTYIGTSAGSIIAGPKCQDYLLSEEESLDGESKDAYGFVNFTVLPHWGSDDFKDLYLNDRLKMAYRINQVPFIILTDNQYIHVVDNHFEIITTN